MKNYLKDKKTLSIIYALSAALLYGISSPMSKVLLRELEPTLMAALLYLGAGLGMFIISIIKRALGSEVIEASMTRNEMPYIIGMILLDIAAPIFLLIGLSMTRSANVSLLNNFEIVATALIALIYFKESIGRRMWYAIFLITLSSIMLSISDISTFSFSLGSLFALLACLAWGLENNLTRMLSLKDPIQIVVVKGFGSGLGALIIALILNESSSNYLYMFITLVLGFFAYGLSIFLYIKAQRDLGAARTSAFYAAAPFMGVIISWVFLREPITSSFIGALIIMIIGSYYAITESHEHKHIHMSLTHNHSHSHDDGHHNHQHDFVVSGKHSHIHIHEELEHDHGHYPDLHHTHIHQKL